MGKKFDEQRFVEDFQGGIFYGSKTVFPDANEFVEEIEDTYGHTEPEIDTIYMRYSVGTHIEMEGEHGYWQVCDKKEDKGAFPVWWLDYTDSKA